MFIKECLYTLQRQSFTEYSTILVDNGSSDGSVDLIREKFPEVKIFALNKNLGFAGGNNVALKIISTPYVALLNNDAMPHPDWLKNLVDTLEEHPEAGFAASKMLHHHNPGRIDRAGDVYTTAGHSLVARPRKFI